MRGASSVSEIQDAGAPAGGITGRLTRLLGRRNVSGAPWLASGAILVMVVVVFIPFISLVRASLGRADGAGLTFNNYGQIVSSSYDLAVLRTTVITSALAAVVTLVLAFPVAFYVVRSNDRMAKYVMLAIISPMLVSVVVRSYALTLLLGPGNPVDKVLPNALQFNFLYTGTGVLIGLVYTMFPFMVLVLVPVLRGIDPLLVDAARALGANRRTTFWQVVLPLSLPGVEAGCLLVFTLSATAFALPLLIGGTSYKMLVYLIYQDMLVLFNWPEGYALCIILLAVCSIVLALSRRLTGRRQSVPLQ